MGKYCPNCGGNRFKAVIKRPGAIQITDGGVTILKEGEKYEYEVVQCVDCKADTNNEALLDVKGVPCSVCNGLFPESELTNGMCIVCNAKNSREELANATPEDLIKMILELEKGKKKGGVKNTGKSTKKKDTAAASKNTAEPVASIPTTSIPAEPQVSPIPAESPVVTTGATTEAAASFAPATNNVTQLPTMGSLPDMSGFGGTSMPSMPTSLSGEAVNEPF